MVCWICLCCFVMSNITFSKNLSRTTAVKDTAYLNKLSFVWITSYHDSYKPKKSVYSQEKYDTETNDGNLVILHFLTHNHQLQMLVVLGWVCNNCLRSFKLYNCWRSFRLNKEFWLHTSVYFHQSLTGSVIRYLIVNNTLTLQLTLLQHSSLKKTEGYDEILKVRSHWHWFEQSIYSKDIQKAYDIES